MHKKEQELLDRYVCRDNMAKLYAGRPLGSIHIAVLMKRGNIIAEAYNNISSRRRGSGHSTFTIHAERNVVKQLGDISQMKGADMYVIRIYRINTRSPIQPDAPSFIKYNAAEECCSATDTEHFKGSEPCSECSIFLDKCLRQYGLRNVYYTR
jgi:hypothetical protein